MREGLRTLYDLQALDTRYGEPSRLGFRLAKLPLDPHIGAMLVEAEKVLEESFVLYKKDGGRSFHYGTAMITKGDIRMWRKDYEADEAGTLPAGLKRGVLSQDALYDLLCEDRALLRRMAELGSP